MPVRKKSSINLLPADKFAASPVGRLLSWLLSTFRVIVILIELVVMAAFLSRFWLDAKNSDLNDELEQKTALVQASSDFEKQFNLTKKKVEIFNTLAKTKSRYSDIVTELAPMIPQEVTLLSIAQTPSDIKLTGISPTEKGIAQLISNLENHNSYSEVDLDQLKASSDNETLLGFSITIYLADGGKEKK